MHKVSGIMVISVSMILLVTLILSGCSSSSSTTSTTSIAQTTTTSKTTSLASTSTTSMPTSSAPITTTNKPATSATTQTTTSGPPIKIGVITTLSGVFTSLSVYMLTGAQMVVDKINKSGGLLGRQVQLITHDDMADPSQIPIAASALQSEGVVALYGTFMDSCDSALSVWANTNKMLFACTMSQADYLRTTGFSKYVFTQCTMSSVDGKVMAREIAKQNDVKSIYYIASDLVMTRGLHDAFWTEMNLLKPGVIDLGAQYLGIVETDMTGIIAAAMAKKPDLILTIIGGPSWPQFVNQATQLKLFNKVKLSGAFILSGEATLPFGKDYPVGIQALTATPYWLDTPEMQAYTQDFYNRTQLYPGDLTNAYYMTMLALTEAIKKAGTTDTDKVIAAWENLTMTNTPLGTISYYDYDHQANSPLWYGTTGYSSDFPQAIALNMVKYQDNLYPTKDEVLAIRAGK